MNAALSTRPDEALRECPDCAERACICSIRGEKHSYLLVSGVWWCYCCQGALDPLTVVPTEAA